MALTPTPLEAEEVHLAAQEVLDHHARL
jgi:hypothetical protein